MDPVLKLNVTAIQNCLKWFCALVKSVPFYKQALTVYDWVYS